MSKGGGSSGNTSTTTSTTAPNPQFAQAYQNLTDRAFNVADQPLTQYTGPLVAGFTPQQTQGFQTIQNLQGSYAPYLNAGAQEISQSTAPIWSGLPSFDTSQLPQGALDRINQSSDFATAAGTQPIAEKTDPYASFAGTTAQNLPGQVAPFTGFAGDTARALPGQVAPYAGQASNIAGNLQGQAGVGTGIATDQARALPGQISLYTGKVSDIAGGLQGQAGSAANLANTAAASAPGNISTYQNPYTTNVTDALSKLFNQQNAEQLAQQRGSTVGAGAYGGDRQAVSEALLGKQQQLAEAPVLANVQQQGYQQAVQSALQDAQMRAQTGLGAGQLTTQAGLGAGQLGLGAAGATTQAAQTAGQLGLGAAGATTQAGQAAGQLGLGAGQLTTQAGLGAGQLGLGAGQLTSQTGLGAGQLGLGAGQLTGQSLAQQGQLGLGAGQLQLGGGQQLFNEFNQQQGAQQQADTTNRWLNQGAGYGLASLGSQAQNLGLAGAAANIGAGAQQQGLAQQQLNIPYEQFIQRQNYPYQQLNFLAPIVEGTGSQAGGTSSTSVPGPSTGSQLLGLGAAGAGVLGATGAFGDSGYLTGSGGLLNPGPGDLSNLPGAYDSAINFAKHGGRVGLAAGGLPGMALPLSTGVPDVSVDMVPALTGNARSPLVSEIAAPQTTTQTTGSSGGGGGGLLSGLGPVSAALNIGKTIAGFFKDGGLAGGGEPAEPSDSTAGLETQQPIVTPNQQAGYERYASLPEEKLRELTLQVPQGSQQGQLIRRALQQKQMGTQPAQQTPQNLPSTYLPLQSKGLEGYAKGGSADTVSEADMDPQPVVDHSGPTVRIHYPSEGGRILDLGIPSSPDRPGFAIGGTPAPPLSIAPLSHLSTSSRPGTPTDNTQKVLPYTQGNFAFTQSPTGVGIPYMYQGPMFAPPGVAGNAPASPGGGLGDWFQAQPQLIPDGNNGFVNAPKPPPPPVEAAPAAPPVRINPNTGNPDTTIDANGISYITPMYAAGGRTGLAAGGQGASQGQGTAGIDLGPPIGAMAGVPHISLDYMMAPGPVVRGPGPPKPPPASQGAEPSGLDPAKILSNVKAFSGLAKGLSGKDEEGGLARGGRAGGGLAGDDDDDSGLMAKAPLPPIEAKADLPPVEPRAAAKLPKAEPAAKTPSKEEPPPGPPRPPAQGLEGTTSLPYAEQAMGLSPVAQIAKAVTSAGYNQGYTPGTPQDPDLAFRQLMALRGDTSLMPQEKPAPRTNDVSGVQEAPTPETVIPSKSTAEPSPPSAAPPTPAPVEAAKPSAPERKADTAKPPDTVQPSQIGAIPKLITEKAAAYGVPPAAATRFAQLESGMGQNLGTRGNVYQLGPNEWASMGGGDMRDTETNIDRGVKYVAHDYEIARAKLGREPQEIEAYMVHQQGDAGGPALLAAPNNASAVDVLTQANGGNRQAAQEAIIQNQGDLSMTAGQFVALQKARLDGVKPNLSASQLVFHGGAPDQIVGRGAQPDVMRTGYAIPSSSPAQGVNIPEPHQYEPGAGANPWLALAAAGLGTMAGRSPFALQNIGTGGLEGVKVLQQQEAEKMKTAQIANEAANRQATLGLEKARLTQTDVHQAQQLGIQQDEMVRKAQQFAQTMNLDWAKLDETHKNNLVTEAYKNTLAELRQAQQERGTWQHGVSGIDPATGKEVIGSKFYPTFGGDVTFHPEGGASAAKTTGAERIMKDLMDSGAAGDPNAVPYADRLIRAQEILKDPRRTEKFVEEGARKYAADLARNAALAVPPKTIDEEAVYRQHRADLRQQFGLDRQTPQQSTVTTEAAPTSAGPPAWAKAPPAVSSSGKAIYWDGTGWFNPDHTAYKP